MDSTILLVLRIGLLILLWLFILFVLLNLRKDTNTAATTVAAPVASTGSGFGRRRKLRGDTPSMLEIVEGPMVGSRMELGSLSEITIGRSNECDFIVGDDYASARHARLSKRGTEWFVEDLDSRNGTFVGGMRIDQPEKLGVGSEIKVGRSTVRLA